MDNSRIKNSKRNIISGIIKQSTSLILAFVTRSLILYILGAEYQGLTGLFSSILQVLNLADLGFSTAVTFILYKPISEKNTNEICAVLNALRKIYIVVGAVITAAGLCILPFLNRLINDEVPTDINIYILFLIYLFSIALSYFLFAYKNTLLTATQREDVISNIYTITSLTMRVIQIAILLIYRNYTSYIAVIVIENAINNILIEIASRKLYPELFPRGKISAEIKNELYLQVQGVCIGKLSDVARNSFDNIIISYYLGLVAVAIYGNYYYIYSSLYGCMGIIIHGMSASIGNSIATENVVKNHKNMQLLNYLFMMVVGWCTVCMFCLYQPFMNIWMNGNRSMLLSDLNMTLFCIYFYAINMTYVRSMYLDGKGLFYQCRYWCIAEAIGNLLLNILFGKYWGITGILLATIITIIVFNFAGRTKVLFKYYFKSGLIEFYLEHFLYALMTITVAVATKIILDFVSYYFTSIFYVRVLLCILLTTVFFWLINLKYPLFNKAKPFLERIIKRDNRINNGL